MINKHIDIICTCLCVTLFFLPSSTPVPATPPSLMDPDFLGSGNVNITWTQPEGVVSGYQLFYRISSAAGSEVVVNITGPRITHETLFSLLAGATYSVSILAYADLPTERSDVLEITLNGEYEYDHHCTAKRIQWNLY